MTNPIAYNPAAAHQLLKKKHLRGLEPSLLAARDAVFKDIELMASGDKIPKAKRPLDAGFIQLPADLLEEYDARKGDSQVGRIEALAGQLRDKLDRFVVLGIGGSYMGARALFEALCHPYHNELTRKERKGIPRIYFQGHNIDNDVTRGLLELLGKHATDKSKLDHRWGLTVISKSGGTLETAVAFRLFRDALEAFYGTDAEESRKYVVPVTGEAGKLRDLSNAREYPATFPIPDGVGGRFSVLTAVGLLPAAMLGLNIRELLQGAADMTERFDREPPGSNPVLDYVATSHLLEEERGLHIRVLSTWGGRLEALGLWYDQLLSESLGKEERGATPITVVNTRDLHSRGQQHQEGAPNKLITNLIVQSPTSEPVAVPAVPEKQDLDQLNYLKGKALPDLLAAAIQGTNEAYAEAGRPTADLLLPTLNEHTMGQLLQMLMLATAVEGRLIGINPYGQPGVEAYKNNMGRILKGQ